VLLLFDEATDQQGNYYRAHTIRAHPRSFPPPFVTFISDADFLLYGCLLTHFCNLSVRHCVVNTAAIIDNKYYYGDGYITNVVKDIDAAIPDGTSAPIPPQRLTH
jgi:hypothetical protein